VYAQHAGDPQQRRNAGVRLAGLDVLVNGAAHPGGKEHRFLGSVLAEPRDADTVADGAALLEEPGVVIGQVGHQRNAGLIMIASQPGKPGFL
jgi:hypothetical protein